MKLPSTVTGKKEGIGYVGEVKSTYTLSVHGDWIVVEFDIGVPNSGPWRFVIPADDSRAIIKILEEREQ